MEDQNVASVLLDEKSTFMYIYNVRFFRDYL